MQQALNEQVNAISLLQNVSPCAECIMITQNGDEDSKLKYGCEKAQEELLECFNSTPSVSMGFLGIGMGYLLLILATIPLCILCCCTKRLQQVCSALCHELMLQFLCMSGIPPVVDKSFESLHPAPLEQYLLLADQFGKMQSLLQCVRCTGLIQLPCLAYVDLGCIDYV
jgi:hypothetical protein